MHRSYTQQQKESLSLKLVITSLQRMNTAKTSAKATLPGNKKFTFITSVTIKIRGLRN